MPRPPTDLAEDWRSFHDASALAQRLLAGFDGEDATTVILALTLCLAQVIVCTATAPDPTIFALVQRQLQASVARLREVQQTPPGRPS